MKKKVIVFGTGYTAKICFDEIREKYEILYFVELNESKIGGKFSDYEIYPTSTLKGAEFDEIILCNLIDINVFYNELEKFHLDEFKINDTCSLNFIKPRITFLK